MLSFPYKTIIEGFVDAGETSSPLFGFASKAVVVGASRWVYSLYSRRVLASYWQGVVNTDTTWANFHPGKL